MVNDIKDEASDRMGKSLDALSNQFNKIRTGRAHPSLLDGLRLEYYGSDTPLNQVANSCEFFNQTTFKKVDYMQ